MHAVFLEDLAVDTFVAASFGAFVMALVQGYCTAPSWQTFRLLACGGALACDRHTMTTSLWLTGAPTVKHCARCSVCLGCPLDNRRWHLWGAVIRLAAPLVPAGEVMRAVCDETTKTNAGTQIEGLDRDRHGARSARQAYRTLRGVHFVLGMMRLPRTRWPGHSLSVPGGLERSLHPAPAHQLHVPYRSRSQLARAIRDGMAAQWPGRPIRSLADGGYATKDSGGFPRRPLWSDASPSTPRAPRCRPRSPTNVVVPRVTQATGSARPRPWHRPPRGGHLTPATQGPSYTPGVDYGTRGCLGASCGS
jgi:hypothetical protein